MIRKVEERLKNGRSADNFSDFLRLEDDKVLSGRGTPQRLVINVSFDSS